MAVKKKPAVAGKTPKAPKARMHYTAAYLVDPAHPVTINVVGCGGTGSQVLNSLARMNKALKALGHPGLYVRAIDPDRVSEANLGRQLFSPADVNEHKCITLIGRINKFFGYDWEAIPLKLGVKSDIPSANITITCVDSGEARTEIKSVLHKWGMAYYNFLHSRPYDGTKRVEPYQTPYYWMDFGNMQDRGQVVIGTLIEILQPEKSEFECLCLLPTIDELHPEILIDNPDDDQGPSCSLAEALGKQDLFINTNLANKGMAILWKMFREARTRYHGAYVNLETLADNPIKV